jgi:long-chain fatty acid transport protein
MAVRCRGLRRGCGVALLLCAMVGPAHATNGFNLYAFGTESSAMGGADVAFVRDTAALVTNPAGLVHIGKQQLDTQLDPYYLIDVRHSDSLGNDAQNQPRVGGFSSAAYARRVSDRLVLGLGSYVAGGLGFEYEDLASGFGTRGDIVTRFSVIRVAPGLAWEASDRLAVGASLSINYAAVRQKYFADSSVFNALDMEQTLFGFRIDGLKAFGFGVNLGLKYALDDEQRWVLGAAYRSRSDLDLDDGKLTVNYEALGAGRIAYRDVQLKGVSIPQDLQLGLLFKPSERWSFTGEVNWIDWSGAIREFRVEAAAPERNPLPLLIPNQIEQRQTLDWRDQFVWSAGAMFVPDGNWRFMAGYNHGKQPVPRENLTPLTAAIPESHYALGAARAFWTQWDIRLGVVYIDKKSVRYRNPNDPITADARETHETFALLIGFGRSW